MIKCAPTFNGFDLSDYLTMTNELDRGIGTGRVNELLEVGKADFKQYRRYRLDSKTIPMPFKMLFNLPEKRRELAGILNVSEPVPLIFPDEPDLYYLATPDGVTGLKEQFILGSGTINWLVPDGVAHAIDSKIYTNVTDGAVGKNLILDPEFDKKNKYWKPWAQLLNEKHDNSNILRGNFTDPTTADNSPTKADHWFQRNEATTRNTPEIKKGDAVSLAIDIRIMVPTTGDSNGSKTAAFILEEWDRIGGTILERHTIRPSVLKTGEWQKLSMINEKIRNDKTTAINLAAGVYSDATVDISKPQMNIGSELLPYSVSGVSLQNQVDIINDGTYKSYPIIRTRMNGENGLVAFVKDNGGILQFGNPEEVDVIQGVRSDKVIDFKFRGGQPELNLNDGGVSKSNVVDFKNKESGSTKENPHKMFSNMGRNLLNPSQFDFEISTSSYGNAADLDGKFYTTQTAVSDQMRQVGIHLDVIRDINNRYPWLFKDHGANTQAEKVEVTRLLLDGSLKLSVYASGSSATIKQVTMQYWAGNEWRGTENNTTDQIKLMEYKNQSGAIIQDDGFIYLIVYSSSSDGTIPSLINIDYVNLEYKISDSTAFSGATTYPNFVGNPETPNLVNGSIDWASNPEAATPVFANGNVNVWGGPRLWGDVPKNYQNESIGDFVYKNRFDFETNVGSRGRLEFVLQNEKDVALAMVIRDSTATKDEIVLECWVEKKNCQTFNLDRKKFPFRFWEAQIQRTGTKIEFKLSGVDKLQGETVIATKYQTFVIDLLELGNMPITGLSTWFMRYGNSPHVLMTWTDSKFTWVNTPTFTNIPNLFDDGDIVEINVKERSVTINGVLNNQLHALGNNWEMFVSENSEEYIQPIASSWANMYEVEIELREAFL